MALVHALVPPRAGSPSCVFCQRRPQLTAEAWMRCASDERTQSQHSQQQLLLLKSPPPRPRRTRPRERTCSQQQRVRGGAGWNLAPRAAGAGPQPQRAPSEDKALTSDGLTLVNFRPSEVKFGGCTGRNGAVRVLRFSAVVAVPRAQDRCIEPVSSAGCLYRVHRSTYVPANATPCAHVTHSRP